MTSTTLLHSHNEIVFLNYVNSFHQLVFSAYLFCILILSITCLAAILNCIVYVVKELSIVEEVPIVKEWSTVAAR